MQQGFFTRKEVESKSRPEGKNYSCASCGLYKDVLTPRMEPYGEFKKGILVVGEAPGEQEDRTGKPWQGKMGQALQRALAKLDINLFEDCLCINACRCRPTDEDGNNRGPANKEIECCRPTLLQIIEDRCPHLILLLGNAALYSLMNHRWKRDLDGIMKWRGFTIPDQDFNAWLCPTFHPSFVERSSTAEETIWIQDLKRAIKCLEVPVPKVKEPKVEYITDLSVLNTISSDLVAIDYECTGIKPQARGHRIVCVAVADSTDHCYVFLLPKSRKERQPFLDLLANPAIGKMAHNMKYEEMWSAERLLQPVQNWAWDSMLAAHILDNRPGITSLKFQVYAHFGIVDYESDVSSFLKGDAKDGNSLNNIDLLIETEEGARRLQYYCALDAVYEYRLAMKQTQEMDYSFLPF